MAETNDDMVSVLMDGIHLKDVVTENGVYLDIDQENTREKAYQMEKSFNTVQSNTYDIDVSLGVESFSTISKDMINITIDGKVKKKIIRQGNGIPVASGSNVTVNLSGYLEYGNEAFDSSAFLGAPTKFSLNDCIEGLQIGISTMQKNEVAIFIIHPDKAYLEMGVPPRIPPNSEVLYKIELLDYEGVSKENGEVDASVTQESKFRTTIKKAKAKYQEGSESFTRKDIRGAIILYKRALGLLEPCRLADKEEESELEKLLLKVYLSLAVCFNKELNPRQACSMCQNALRIDPHSPKALFHYGRAQATLGDFVTAKNKLNKAIREAPDNQKNKDELARVEQLHKDYMTRERALAQKMFQITPKNM